jgi:GGDEF domain-containing protein
VAAAYTIHEYSGEPTFLSGHRIFPWATVGVALAQAGETPSAVCRRADVAMYRAKQRDAGVDASDPVTDAAPPPLEQRPAAKLRNLGRLDPEVAAA